MTITFKRIKNYLKSKFKDIMPADSNKVTLNEEIGCPICNSSSVYFTEYQQARLYRCTGCLLLFFYPAPNAKKLSDYYSSLEGYVPAISKNYQNFDDKRMRALIDQAKLLYSYYAENSQKLGQEIDFLEVGCAFGYQLLAAQQLGWKVKGIEVSSYTSEFARNELKLEVITGGIEDLRDEEQFDIVLMSHVLEHISDPVAVIKKLSYCVKENGIAVVFVPNGAGLQAMYDFSAWEWSDYPGHLYYFTPKSLQILFENNGFDIELVFTCLGHSNVEKLKQDISERLFIDLNNIDGKLMDCLGDAQLLSDLRIVARKRDVISCS